MNDKTDVTVSQLIARFQLRRRASTDAFHTGVRLATWGDVTVMSVTPDLVHGQVRDPSVLHVQLYVDNGALVGRCPCPAATHSVCWHQVAVAHAVWTDLRRSHQRD